MENKMDIPAWMKKKMKDSQDSIDTTIKPGANSADVSLPSAMTAEQKRKQEMDKRMKRIMAGQD
jgi:hypothetical protein